MKNEGKRAITNQNGARGEPRALAVGGWHVRFPRARPRQNTDDRGRHDKRAPSIDPLSVVPGILVAGVFS